MNSTEKMQNNDSILIVGNTLEAYVTAYALSQQFGKARYKVSILKSNKKEFARGISLSYEALSILNRLGISEKLLVENIPLNYKIGTIFNHWGEQHKSLQPLGSHGGPMDMVAFQSFAVKKKQSDSALDFNSYSLGAKAALEAKFVHPQSSPGSILSTLAYSLNLDGDAFSCWAQALCESRDIAIVEGDVAEVLVDEASNFINTITLSDNSQLSAELIIDCSNESQNKLSDKLSVHFNYWNDLFSNHREINFVVKQNSENLPVTQVANKEGVIHQQVVIGDDVFGKVYYSEDLANEESVINSLSISKEASFKASDSSEFFHGIRERAWLGNYVALGGAYGNYYPFDACNFYGFLNALERLITLFPRTQSFELEAYEFNRKTQLWYENMRDFNLIRVLGLGSQKATTTQFEMLPESFQHKFELFTESAQLAYYEEEPFAEHYRVSTFINMDFWPSQYDPLLDRFDFVRLDARFNEMRETISSTVRNMPNHQEYLTSLKAQK